MQPGPPGRACWISLRGNSAEPRLHRTGTGSQRERYVPFGEGLILSLIPKTTCTSGPAFLISKKKKSPRCAGDSLLLQL